MTCPARSGTGGPTVGAASAGGEERRCSRQACVEGRQAGAVESEPERTRFAYQWARVSQESVTEARRLRGPGARRG
jgi:hypothetical protein